jgi:hypothetical protein
MCGQTALQEREHDTAWLARSDGISPTLHADKGICPLFAEPELKQSNILLLGKRRYQRRYAYAPEMNSRTARTLADGRAFQSFTGVAWASRQH